MLANVGLFNADNQIDRLLGFSDLDNGAPPVNECYVGDIYTPMFICEKTKIEFKTQIPGNNEFTLLIQKLAQALLLFLLKRTEGK